MPLSTRPVLVCYIDKSAECQVLEEMFSFAVTKNIPAVLLDTYSKEMGGLFDWVSERRLRSVQSLAEENRVEVALAGSLSLETVERAKVMSPSIVAVRTAVCQAGRRGNLCAIRVRRLKKILTSRSPNEPPLSKNFTTEFF